MEAGERQQAFAHGSCSRLFHVFSGQEAKCFEHNNRRQRSQPAAELQLHWGLVSPEDRLPHVALAVPPSALPRTVNTNFPQIKRKQVEDI